MSRNVKAKARPSGNQPAIPGGWSEILFTRYRVVSVFQRGLRLDVKARDEEKDNACQPAVVKQFGLFGDVLRCGVLLPLNSDLWRELPVERGTGEGGLE